MVSRLGVCALSALILISWPTRMPVIAGGPSPEFRAAMQRLSDVETYFQDRSPGVYRSVIIDKWPSGEAVQAMIIVPENINGRDIVLTMAARARQYLIEAIEYKEKFSGYGASMVFAKKAKDGFVETREIVSFRWLADRVDINTVRDMTDAEIFTSSFRTRIGREFQGLKDRICAEEPDPMLCNMWASVKPSPN